MSGVDYNQPDVARRNSRGRALPESVLDRWRATVVPLLPARVEVRLLDVGVGTAIFARAWPRWLPCRVVEDAGPATIGRAAERIRQLRHADSLLGQFTDEEIAIGLQTMDALDPSQPLGPSTLGLLAFTT